MYKIQVRPQSGRELAKSHSFSYLRNSQNNRHHATINRTSARRVNFLIAALTCFLTVALSGCGGLVWNSGVQGAIVPSPGKVVFGAVPIGQNTSSQISLKNQRPFPVTISSIKVSGNSFSLDEVNAAPVILAAGGTLGLNVSFHPASAGAMTGKVSITGSTSTSPMAVISLEGTGSTATAQPALNSVTCGTLSLTSLETKACSIYLTGPAVAPFVVSLSSNNATVSVPNFVTVQTGATSTGFNAIASTISSSQSVTLTASSGGLSKTFVMQLVSSTPVQSGGSTLSISPSNLSFGDAVVNSTTSLPLTLKSTGSLPVTISAATLSGSAFSVSGVSFPITINAGQAINWDVQFNPSTTGATTGQLSITSNSSTNNPAAIGLSGTGVLHKVQLSWDAPNSSIDPIVGYRVYRSTVNASTFHLQNSTILTQTTYLDTTIESGQSYDYIVKSLDLLGIESIPSNRTTVTIP